MTTLRENQPTLTKRPAGAASLEDVDETAPVELLMLFEMAAVAATVRTKEAAAARTMRVMAGSPCAMRRECLTRLHGAVPQGTGEKGVSPRVRPLNKRRRCSSSGGV